MVKCVKEKAQGSNLVSSELDSVVNLFKNMILILD